MGLCIVGTATSQTLLHPLRSRDDGTSRSVQRKSSFNHITRDPSHDVIRLPEALYQGMLVRSYVDPYVTGRNIP